MKLHLILLLIMLVAVARVMASVDAEECPDPSLESMEVTCDRPVEECPDHDECSALLKKDLDSFFELEEDDPAAACKIKKRCSCTHAYFLHCEPLAEQEQEFVVAVCFSGDTEIETPAGRVAIRSLAKKGRAMVRANRGRNQTMFVPILMWLHAEEKESDFVEIETEKGHKLSTTPKHVIYVVPCDQNGEMEPKFSEELKIGDCVMAEVDKSLVPTRIAAIHNVRKQGLYTFLTETGTMLADGIVASSFSGSRYTRMALPVYKMIHNVSKYLPENGKAKQLQGLHPVFKSIMKLSESL